MSETDSLAIDHQSGVLVLTPRAEFASLSEPEIMQHAAAVRQELDASAAHDVVIDLGQLSYFGSTVLEWMAQIWKHVKPDRGRLALAAPSPIAREVLSAARFDTLWDIFSTRHEALDSLVNKQPQASR